MMDVDELAKALIRVGIESENYILLAEDIRASPWGQRVQAREAELVDWATVYADVAAERDEWEAVAKRATEDAEHGTALAVEYHAERDRLREAAEDVLVVNMIAPQTGWYRNLRAALDGKELAP